jgi:hypothetical protein
VPFSMGEDYSSAGPSDGQFDKTRLEAILPTNNLLLEDTIYRVGIKEEEEEEEHRIRMGTGCSPGDTGGTRLVRQTCPPDETLFCS